jgi:hypothetical protein
MRSNAPAPDASWPWCEPPSDRYEHTFGVQFGVQFESNSQELSSTRTNNGGPHQLTHTPTLGLGAGRSQVQILSPRLQKRPANTGLFSGHGTVRSVVHVPFVCCSPCLERGFRRVPAASELRGVLILWRYVSRRERERTSPTTRRRVRCRNHARERHSRSWQSASRHRPRRRATIGR